MRFSTISKILRHKREYLADDIEGAFLFKRPKGRAPDIKKALFNWTRKCAGTPLTDRSMREKAISFANACSFPEVVEEVSTVDWLEQFKKEYKLLSTDDWHHKKTVIDFSEKPKKNNGRRDYEVSMTEQQCKSSEMNTKAMNPPPTVHDSGVVGHISHLNCPGIYETYHAMELIVKFFMMRNSLSNEEHAIIINMMERLKNNLEDVQA
jgi:hypothetical protein